jgi:hypothetical protein
MKKLVKVVVTVPEHDAAQLRQAIGSADGGKLGNYTYCSFSVKGVGRFLPKEGAQPIIGKVGELEEVIEERIEITCEHEKLPNIIAAIRRNHPYEEPVIDVYSLL